MGVFNNFPYTNIHELNLDWIIKKVKYFDETLESIVAEKAEEYFNRIFINAVYDEATETITLSIEEISNG